MSFFKSPDTGGGTPADDFRRHVREWFVAKHFSEVDLIEDNAPHNDPYDDYELVYIAKFVPRGERQAQLEIRVTDYGSVGTGVETRERISKRLNARRHRDGFAAGFEPRLRDVGEVMLLLDLVSSGAIAIEARIVPWYGLGRTWPSLPSRRDPAAVALYKEFNFSTSVLLRLFARTVTFEAWQ